MRWKEVVRYFVCLLLVCICAGCSLFKARPGKVTGFLPYSEKLQDMSERTPFQQGLIPDEAKWETGKQQYSKILIEPVLTHFAETKLMKSPVAESLKESRRSSIKELARYFEQKLKISLEECEGKKFAVVEQSNDALVLQLALTAVDPTDTVLTIAASAAGLLVPGAGLIQAAGSGRVAMESAIRDGNTGEILAVFKDREGDKNSAFSLKDYQMYGHIRAALDEWAGQFCAVLSAKQGQVVDDSLPLTLNPF